MAQFDGPMPDGLRRLCCYVCSDLIGYGRKAEDLIVCCKCRKEPAYHLRHMQHRMDDLCKEIREIRHILNTVTDWMARKG